MLCCLLFCCRLTAFGTLFKRRNSHTTLELESILTRFRHCWRRNDLLILRQPLVVTFLCHKSRQPIVISTLTRSLSLVEAYPMQFFINGTLKILAPPQQVRKVNTNLFYFLIFHCYS